MGRSHRGRRDRKEVRRSGQSHAEELTITIRGPFRRYIRELAIKDEATEAVTVFRLIREGINNSMDTDIDVPGDMFLGHNIGMADASERQEVLSHAEEELLPGVEEGETVLYTNELAEEIPLTRQYLLDGIARLQRAPTEWRNAVTSP